MVQGKPSSDLPAYNSCVEAHKAFHVEAGKVAVLINETKFTEAELLLASGSNYSRASTNVSGILIKLKHESAKAA